MFTHQPLPPYERLDELDKPHEECGVFGIFAPGEDAARLTFFAKDDLFPSFSLDGRSIVFTNGDAAQFLSTGSTQDIPPGDNYIIANTGGTPVALSTNTASDENDPELLPLTQTRKPPRNFSGRRRNRVN